MNWRHLLGPLAALALAAPAWAGQVPAPINAPATVASGDALRANGTNPQQAADSGISLTSQSANTVLAGPTSGGATAPTFRGMTANDIPGTLNAITVPTISITTGLTNPAAPTTAGHAFFYEVAGVSGTQTGSTFNFNLLAITDTLNANSNTSQFDNDFTVNCSLAAGFSGNRECVDTFLNVSASALTNDPTVHFYIDDQITAQGAAAQGGVALNNADSQASLWGLDSNTFLVSGATNWADVFSAEIDVGVASGASANRVFGADIILDSLAAVPGNMTYDALSFGAKAGATALWRCGICFGSEQAFWPFNSSSTLIGAVPKQVPSLIASIPANIGIDWRQVTFTTGAIEVPNAGIDATGTVYGGNLTIGSTITAQSGGISALTAAAFGGVTGGAYFGLTALPTITIGAPPNGGTRAAATVTHIQLTQVILFVGTDVGCTNGDVLTEVGGTGTHPTMTLTVVGGAVTAVAITTPGDLTTAPGSTPTTTGGTCSVQPAINMGWGIKTTPVGTAGTQYVGFPLPPVFVNATSNTENIPAVLTPTMSTSGQTLQIGATNFTSTVSAGGTAGVTCASVSAATMTVSNGIVTHC